MVPESGGNRELLHTLEEGVPRRGHELKNSAIGVNSTEKTGEALELGGELELEIEHRRQGFGGGRDERLRDRIHGRV